MAAATERGVEVLVFDCFFYYTSLVTFVCQTLIKRLGYDMGSTHDARQKQGLRGSLPLWSYSKPEVRLVGAVNE